MSSNDEQIKYWNEQGHKWVEGQEQLDALVGPIGDRMLATADAQPGERVLDVGCGCGSTTLALAARVAPNGSVTGVDISEPMLARARARATEANTSGIEFVQADAQTHALELESIDLITSRFGVMFFSNPRAAFANLCGALRAGGRLAFVCWQPLAENDWMRIPIMAALPELPEPPATPEPGAPGPFAFGDDDLVRSILGDAGFEAVEIASLRSTLSLGGASSIDEGVEFVLRVGPTGRVLAGGDEDLIQRVRKAVRTALEPYASDQGLAMGYAAWLVSATRP